jgi:hypothetical protein
MARQPGPALKTIREDQEKGPANAGARTEYAAPFGKAPRQPGYVLPGFPG